MNEDTLPIVDLPDVTPEPPKDCRTCSLAHADGTCGFLSSIGHTESTPTWEARVGPQQRWADVHEWTADHFPIDTQYDCPEWVGQP